MAVTVRLYLSLLLVLGIGLAWFDWRTLRVPNRVTLVLLSAGLVINLPGNFNLWAASTLVILAWRMRWMGGGDSKLWLALFWLSPPAAHMVLPLIFGFIFVVTGMGQLVWRRQKCLPLYGVPAPGAWRVVPFIAWLIWMG